MTKGKLKYDKNNVYCDYFQKLSRIMESMPKLTINDRKEVLMNERHGTQEEICFDYLQKNVHLVGLPSELWCFYWKKNHHILFLKVENDFTTTYTVLIDSNMNLKIYLLGELLDWVQCDKPKSINAIESILKVVDKF